MALSLREKLTGGRDVGLASRIAAAGLISEILALGTLRQA
jgi:hypothetical protein